MAALVATALSGAEPALAKPSLPSFRPRQPAAVLARNFEADYRDNLHPMCERHVRVERNAAPGGGWIAHFSGTDVGPPGIGGYVMIACDEENIEKYKLRTFEFDARISDDGVSVDARDGVHSGLWYEVQPDGDQPGSSGIQWNDGNKWTVMPAGDLGSPAPAPPLTAAKGSKEQMAAVASLAEGMVAEAEARGAAIVAELALPPPAPSPAPLASPK